MATKFLEAKEANSRLRKSMRGKSQLEITATLGAEILSGERAPGTRLPSADEMYQTFGVSRVVVREVMRTLAAKGMITSKTRVGTKVTDPIHWNWLDPQILEWRAKIGLDQAFMTQLSQVRLALEPAAASLAAENRTEHDLVILRSAIKGMYGSGDDHQSFSKADRNFHDAVIAATHNPFFSAFNSATELALLRFLGVSSLSVTVNERTHIRSAGQHEKILEAIAARDPSSAAKAMTRVIKDGLKYASAVAGSASSTASA